VLTTAPVLALIDPNGGQLYITCDTSNLALGMVLSQDQGGVERTLMYHNRLLKKSERNYCITQRELLAIVEAVRAWHHYVAGAHFTVRSDHRPLVWLRNLKAPQGRLARWIEKLAAYDFDIVYTRPTQLTNADALSRYPVRPCGAHCTKCKRVEQLDQQANDGDVHPDGDGANVFVTALESSPGFSPADWIQAQNADRDISPILAAIQAGRKPSLQEAVRMSDTTHALFLQYDSLALRDGLLLRRFEHHSGKPEKDVYQLVVPRNKVQQLLRLYHDAPGSGSHQGRAKTLALVRARFYWPGYSQDVVDYCDACQVCRERSGPGRRVRAPLRVWQEGRMFGRWHADIAGPYPVSREGYRYVLVVVEALTSFPEVIPMRKCDANAVARALVQVWSRYGACRVLRTDQGRAFESKLLQQVLDIFAIDRVRTTPGRPQANGKAERMIRVIKDGLAKFIEPGQKDWPDFLPLILLSYRAAVHSALKYSPAELMYGRRLVLPADLYTCPPEPPAESELRGLPADLRDVLRDLHHEAAQNLTSASHAMKMRYDGKARITPFRQGDMVWFYNPQRKKGINPKLQRPWECDWQITKVINDITVRIEREGKRPRVVHVDRLSKQDAAAGRRQRGRKRDGDPLA